MAARMVDLTRHDDEVPDNHNSKAGTSLKRQTPGMSLSGVNVSHGAI
jgi:hypothetical protein